MTTQEWSENRALVLQGLRENREDHLIIRTKLEKLSNDLTAVKIKAGIYGMIAGAIPAIIAVILMFKVGK